MQRIGTIRVTVNRAKKELEIEQRLNEMKEEWQSMSLLIHEDTRNIAVKSSSSDDTYEIKVIRHASLKNIDDIASLATHQMIDINKLAASRYSAFRIDDLVHWKKFLLRSNEALDKWKMCNRLMSMLLPYFEASSFIKLQGFLKPKTNCNVLSLDLLRANPEQYKKEKERRILPVTLQIEEVIRDKWNTLMADTNSRYAYNLLRAEYTLQVQPILDALQLLVELLQDYLQRSG